MERSPHPPDQQDAQDTAQEPAPFGSRQIAHVVAISLLLVILLAANGVALVSSRAGVMVDPVVAAVRPVPDGEVVDQAGLAPPAAPAAAEPVAEPQPQAAVQPEPQPEPPPAPEPPPLPPGEVPRIQLAPAEPRLAPFVGLSTWVDLYDTDLSPVQQADIAAAAGVQAIYVQTARYNSPGDIHDPGRLAALIERAHDHGLLVMAWYLPGFLDPQLDLRRSQAAINFTTPRGDRPDAFGMDIEVEKLRNVAERSRRLIALSVALRAWVGPEYPMSAIVLPPLQLDMRPSWWPGFPFAEIRPYYDVFIPMSYSSYRGTDVNTTFAWNLNNVLELRIRAGHPALPIHLAGGIADRLPQLEAFVRAAAGGRVLGAGLYDLHTTRPEAWRQLRALRAE